MLRLSLFFSVCLHILLLGVASVLVSQQTTHESPMEKRFRVGLRKSIAAKSETPVQKFDKAPFTHSKRQLPQFQELALPPSTLQKTHQKKPVEKPSIIPVSSRILKKHSPNVPTIRNMPSTIQDFVVEAHEFPTPIPTKKPGPVPIKKPTPVPTTEPTPVPAEIAETREQPQPVEMSDIPTPTATTPPRPSPTPVVKSVALSESDVPPTPLHTSTAATPATPAADSQYHEKTEATTVKKPETRSVEHAATQQEKALLKRYLQEVAAKINSVKRYPRRARRKGWEGTVVIKLYILATGEVEKAVLVEKSEYDMLNDAALQAITKAQPFPEFQQDLTLQSIIVNVPIQFTLK